MAYSDFSLEDVVKKFKLTEKRALLFDTARKVEMSDWLKETFTMSLDLALSSASEKARSEFIVAPILLEMERRNHKKFAIHSGKRLDVDVKQGLSGECDFILSKGEILHTIRAPIFALLEAKKNDVEVGLGQCAAQMIGARVFNQNQGNNIETIFGCVTTGETWQFLKLAEQTIIVESRRGYINDVEGILGTLQDIIDAY